MIKLLPTTNLLDSKTELGLIASSKFGKITHNLVFFKYQATGNDFILIEDEEFDPKWVKPLCKRRYGIGADGLIWSRPSHVATRKMTFFNCDGQEASMCLNGLRTLFFHTASLSSPYITIETAVGIYKGSKSGLFLPPPSFRKSLTINNLRGELFNTGVEHYIVESELQDLAIDELGRELRHHKALEPAGANINFVQKMAPDEIWVRTYERGVEGETMSCGTGAYACHAYLGVSKSKVRFFHGDELYFEDKPEGTFIKGAVAFVYRGSLCSESIS
ncbi:MAG: hypothetical protein P0S95_03135 [Rhabdochlamydiaceae bacterium]|nr:hypothetical protein [Candidatus Amphrikana amoebophyrae]